MYSVSLLLPINTVVCERGFSMMNCIKTEESGTLNSALSALMYISTDGPSLEDFHPQPPVNYWEPVCAIEDQELDRKNRQQIQK